MGDLRPGHLQQLAPLIPQDSAQLVVDLETAFVGRGNRHADQPQLEVTSKALLACAQGFFRPLELDQLRSLPRVKIGQPQLVLRWTMSLPKVRRYHSQRFPAAAEQRSGLRRAKAGRGSNLQVRRKVRIGMNVFDD